MKYITYGELRFRSKGQISYKDIKGSVPSIRKRMHIAFAGIIAAFILMGVLFYVLQLDTPYSFMTFTITLLTIVLLSYRIFRYLDKFNLQDLLKVYSKLYSLSGNEKTDMAVLIDRIKRERINSFLGECMDNEEYIKNLMENAKDRMERSKKDFKLNELGIAAVALVVTNCFFGRLYDNWKEDGSIQIIVKTILIFVIIAAFSLYYYLWKDIYLQKRNADYRHHKQLYGILRDLETRAKFNKPKEAF